jgi:hypothetical protein
MLRRQRRRYQWSETGLMTFCFLVTGLFFSWFTGFFFSEKSAYRRQR